jgi:hypothetical protein
VSAYHFHGLLPLQAWLKRYCRFGFYGSIGSEVEATQASETLGNSKGSRSFDTAAGEGEDWGR